MVTPEPSDPASPTRRVEPAPATARLDPGRARTRWATRILRPGAATTVTDTLPDAPAGATARLRRPTASGAAPPPAGPAAPSWWQRAFGPLITWFSRLIARVVVGPAGEIDYAIPAELRRSYNVLGYIGSGGEAVVYLAEPGGTTRGDSGGGQGGGTGTGRRIALKVYRPGHDINRELLDRLRARGEADPHTPAIHGYGTARSSWGEDVAWEAQEYFAHGSLRSLMDDAPLSPDRARAVVEAVAACLHHWQDSLQHNHTDVKPENLLVRSLDPPVFALTDFGGAVRATMSRVYGGLAITEDYAAPEVVEGRREAPAAWWSLGVMVHEMMTGRRPERGENWLTARSTEVDVSAIADDAWRLLARGLLTPAPSARWGHAEVRQWLAGERPSLVKARSHAPIRFADVTHEDAPSLAFDLLDRSDKGEVWLRTHWPTLRTWLDREVNDYTFDRAYLTDLDAHPERVHLAISALGARFVPGMPPRFRGHEVSADGVLALATGDRSRHGVLREAVELGALGLAARHWCGHPACRAEGAGRCALLERVQHEAPLIMAEVRTSVDRIGADVSDARGLPAHEWDSAWAHAVELVLDPDAAVRTRRTLRAQSWHPAQRSSAPHAGWWREQRTAGLRGRAGETAAIAALVTATLLLPAATRSGAVQRDRDRADSRARLQGRWDAATGAIGAGWARIRGHVAGAAHRGPGAAGPGTAGPGVPPAYDPYAPPAGTPEERRHLRRRRSEQKRVDRGMAQIQRAMGAGRCRRFAYPAGLLGLLDGLGRWLRADGFFPEITTPWVSAYESAVDFSQSPPVSALAGAADAVVSLLPADTGHAWWTPVVLGVVLYLLGRTAAGRKRKARTQLIAYRLAVAGSVAMLLLLLSTGFLTVAAGILIPLHNLMA
ncbi:protein kinase [Nocardiopsis sediminis]|uniref:non-specific serine/threonine protein kinase n=1 Tax=Nocardiopsis sediminis TaxID=1778267 RepID=A0ABV8FUZ3_9ACTN